MKKLLVITFLLIGFLTSGYKRPDTYVINAEKNAYFHNNLGTRYLEERCYYAAIQEFKIAISLSPQTQGTAVYYNNLGETYMKIGYPKYAQDCFERAIKLFGLNFYYYQNLAKCFSAQKLTDFKLEQYKKDKNPLSMVMVGLLYLEKSDKKNAIIKLDEFCMQEPDLLMTGAVKAYVKKLTEE